MDTVQHAFYLLLLRSVHRFHPFWFDSIEGHCLIPGMFGSLLLDMRRGHCLLRLGPLPQGLPSLLQVFISQIVAMVALTGYFGLL